ncbi:MAG: sugar phosphate isomerase/epimerase family protein [Planctomycetota bacterium]
MSVNRRVALGSLLSIPAMTRGWADESDATRLSGKVADSSDSVASFPLGVFTKPFNSLSYDELADGIADRGFDGVEATVRKGGNVEPERVQEDLPKLVEAMRRRGCEVLLMATDVNVASDPVGQRVLTTAADLGISYFRCRYVKYDLAQPVATQIDQWRSQFEGLADLCRRLGITGVYQNHAGDRYMGAAIWDLDRVLGDVSPDEVGVAFDIRHAAVEAGTCWPVAWRMILPRVRAVYVKDFQWGETRPEHVPLGQGRVPRRFFQELGASGFRGPISLHEEYLDHKSPSMVPQHWAAIARDLAKLRQYLAS